MIILVTGSRNATDRGHIKQGLAWVARGHYGPDSELWHGGARGADALAASIATTYGWRIREFPADWDRYGKAAGPIRNQQMVDALLHADPRTVGVVVCVAFPQPPISPGTEDCMNRVWRAGIPTLVMPITPAVTPTMAPTSVQIGQST